MALTQVREPPDVAKSHTEAHTGEQVLGFVVPFGPVPCLLRLHPLQLLMGGNPIIQSRVWKFKLHGGLLGALGAGHRKSEDVAVDRSLGFATSLRGYEEAVSSSDGSLCGLDCLCLSPLHPLCVLGRRAGIFTVNYGTAVISSSLQAVVLCNVSYLGKVQPFDCG